jgi:hypothetical protein
MVSRLCNSCRLGEPKQQMLHHLMVHHKWNVAPGEPVNELEAEHNRQHFLAERKGVNLHQH